jgi:c-di-GMP-related signal transduction protein
MKFNILIINTQKNSKKIQKFLDHIEGNNIYICDNFVDVEHTLLTYTIHIMILDTSVLDINEFQNLQFEFSVNVSYEDIENKEIFKLVKNLGATYSQGYYFSAPLEKPKVYSF